MHIICPSCGNRMEPTEQTLPCDVVCPACESSFKLDSGSTAGWQAGDGPRKLGRFELIEPVGSGAFGTVFMARDPELDRVVAVKVPREGSTHGADQRDRFLREARSIAQLRHPSIVTVHEAGLHDGIPYLVSDFVRGVTLAEMLTARRPAPRDTARLVAVVADALHYAHGQGVVHRDVKPSNIMMDEQGEPRLMDFGLAKRETGEVTMTIEGQVLGTPAYMSPEQARGEGHDVDGRSDVYSLGVILYQLLTGDLPFHGVTRMVLYQVLHDEPRPPRSLNDKIPRDLETITLKAMAKEPWKRYPTAKDLGDDLRRWRSGEAIHARPVGRLEKVARWCRRNPLVASLSVALLLVVVSAFTAILTALGSEREQRRLAEENERAANQATLQAEEKTKEEAEARKREETAKLAALDAQGKEAKAREDADRERKAADAARLLAVSRQQQTELALYGSQLTSALYHVMNNNPVLARQTLEGCRWDLRGWEWQHLYSLTEGSTHTLTPHTDTVNVLRLSPDARRLFTAGQDSVVKLHDVASGKEVASIRTPYPLGNRGPYWFTRDGRFVFLPGRDGVVAQHDLATGKLVRSHPWGLNDLQRILTSPDSRLVAAVVKTPGPQGSIPTNTLIISDLADGKNLLKAGGLTGNVSGLVFSGDGRHVGVATASVDPVKRTQSSELRIWEADKDNPAVLDDFPGILAAWALSPDGKRVTTVTHFVDPMKRVAGSRVQVWEPGGGKEPTTLYEQQAPLTKEGRAQSQVLQLGASPDGRQVVTLGATAGEKNGFTLEVRAHDPQTGKEQWKAGWTEGRLAAEYGVHFSPDGRRLLVTAWGELDPRIAPPPPNLAIRSFDAATGKEGVTLREVAQGRAVLSSDGRRLATFGGDPTYANLGEIRVWDVEKAAVVNRLRGHTGVVMSAAVSPDGLTVASTALDGTVKIWDLSPARTEVAGKPHTPNPSGSRDGRRVVATELRQALKIWDSGKAEPQVVPVEDEMKARCVTPLQTGALLAVGMPEAQGLFFAAATVARRQVAGDGLLRAEISPDGRWIAVLNEQNPDATQIVGTSPLWVYDAGTGKLQYELAGYEGAVLGRAVSPDGNRLAVINGGFRSEVLKAPVAGLPDRTVRRWQPGPLVVHDAETGKEVFRIPAAAHGASKVSFSPDGRYLLTTVAADQAGRSDPKQQPEARRHKVWNAQTGEEVYALPEAAAQPMFTADGQHLAWVGNSGMIILFDLVNRKELPPFGPARGILTLSPDGGRVVTRAGASTMQLWETATGKAVATFRTHAGGNPALMPVEGFRRATWLDSLRDSAVFTPDGRRFLYETGGAVTVFDAATGLELVRLPADRVFTPLELMCIREGRSHEALLAGYQALRPRPPRPEERTLRHSLLRFALAFSKDGSRLLAVDPQGWDERSVEERTSDIGRQTVGKVEQLLAWDLATGQEAFAGPPTPASESRGGHHALSADGVRMAESHRHKVAPDREEWVTDVTVTDMAHQTVIFRQSLSNSAPTVALSPDGARLAAVVILPAPKGEPGSVEVHVWDVAEGKEVQTLKAPGKMSLAGATLRFSPDGSRLALASDVGVVNGFLPKQELPSESVLVWDIGAGKELLRHDHAHRARDVVFGKDGRSLTWLSGVAEAIPMELPFLPFLRDQKTMYRLRVRSLELKAWREGEAVKSYPLQVDISPPPPGPFEIRIAEDAYVHAAFSPDGSKVALVHARRFVKVWDTATGKEIAVLPQQGKDIHYLAFSPDGARLATVAQVVDTTPNVPDIDLGPGYTLQRMYSPVTEAQRAPDVKLWDLSTLRPVLSFRPHLDRVEGIAFSPDGSRLATGSRDGTIKITELPAR